MFDKLRKGYLDRKLTKSDWKEMCGKAVATGIDLAEKLKIVTQDRDELAVKNENLKLALKMANDRLAEVVSEEGHIPKNELPLEVLSPWMGPFPEIKT